MKILSNNNQSTSFKNITKLPEIIYFDYDGTIANNSKYLVKAFNYALKCNFDKKKDKNILKEIKKIKKDSEKWAYIKTNCEINIFKKCNIDYDDFLSKQKLKKVRGVMKLIKLLKKYNIPMYVISQKQGTGLRNELKKANLLGNFFINAYGTLDFGELQKPSIEFIDKMRKDNKTKTKTCWMIGDRCSDAITAINMNGKAFIIDKTEIEKIQQNYSNLIGKQIFFTTYSKLTKLVKKLNKKK